MTDGGRTPMWRSEHPAIRWGAYAWAFVGLALAFVLLWRGLGYVRIVLVPLTLALFPAAILIPVARWLEDHGLPPAVAALTVLLTFVAVLFGIGWLMVMQIQAELSGLVEQLRGAYEQLQRQLSDLPVVPEPSALFGGGGGGGAGVAGAKAALGAVTSVARAATQFFIFLVAAFFFIKDRDAITGWVAGLFPDGTRGDAATVGGRMWGTVSAYIRGQTIIAAFDGTMVGLGLWLLGIPLALVLGAIVFFGAFVPVVGSIAAGAVAVVVALVSKGLTAALFTLAIIVGVQQLEGNVLAPYILGREVELHPLSILVAITVGAVLLGVWGAIIAVPVAASAYRAAGYVRDHHDSPA